MWASSIIFYKMGTFSIHFQMVQGMLAKSRMVRRTEKVHSHFLMGKSIKESSRIFFITVKARCICQMVQSMSASGKMVNRTEKVRTLCLLVKSMLACIRVVLSMEKAG